MKRSPRRRGAVIGRPLLIRAVDTFLHRPAGRRLEVQVDEETGTLYLPLSFGGAIGLSKEK